jgi:mono/diheme cytochrome c family protein
MERKMIKKIGLVLFTAVAFASCYYDNEEDLYPAASTCTVGTNISYKNVILPILNNNCQSCHSAASKQGGIDLEGYTQVKKYVANGGLVGSIRHLSGYSKMPQNAAKLSTCNLDKIDKWISEGALNN